MRDPIDLEKLWLAPQEVLVGRVRQPADVTAVIGRWRQRLGQVSVEERLRARGIHCLLRTDTAYPLSLLDLDDPPVVLFTNGRRTPEQTRQIAIVGTRRASGYGLEAATWIGETLAAAGCTIISGLALGIDAAAHQSALSVSGQTVAVLACGIDLCYPPSHQALWLKIQQEGILISEYPPGTPVAKYRFPERNRLIAALAEAVVVVQAGDRSGALVTAEIALDLGRDIYVVPGPITSVHFRGAHRLIQDGASILLDPLQLLQDGVGNPTCAVATVDVPERWRNLYDALDDDVSATELAHFLRTPPAHVYAGLLELELAGLVERQPGGMYRRRHKGL